MTVLRGAIVHDDWPAVLARLTTHAGEAAIADAYGELPLHAAAFCSAPLEVMRALLDAHPAAVSTPNVHGALPLHYTVFMEARIDVVELLLRAYPEAAYVANNNGWLPLHWATLHHPPASLDVVVALLAAYPEAALVRTNTGRLPDLSRRYPAHDIRAALAAASSARRAPALHAWHKLRA